MISYTKGDASWGDGGEATVESLLFVIELSVVVISGCPRVAAEFGCDWRMLNVMLFWDIISK
jgi:hypothetical protein